MAWRRGEERCGIFPLVVNRRHEVNGRGVNIGVVVQNYDRLPVMHSATFEYADTLAEILSILKDLHMIPSDFQFSSLQILDSCKVYPHKDNHDGLSRLFMTGNLDGGLLIVGGTPHNLFRRPLFLMVRKAIM